MKAAQWNVTLEETRETASSLLGFGVCDGRGVVLKLTKGAGDEAHSGEVLRAFGGNGAARVYKSEVGAVLVERLEPGEELVKLVRRGDDDEATRIIAQVIEKLSSYVRTTNHTIRAGIPTVADWGRGFDRYMQSSDQQIPADLVREAHDFYRNLAGSQRTTMLLHGDLQHYNVLFDNNRGWIAADPKGVIGEVECEVGALLRNPVEQPQLFTNRETIERRLKILTNTLPLDQSRTLRWCFAQAVMSAIWSIEDGHRVGFSHPVLLLATTIREMLVN